MRQAEAALEKVEPAEHVPHVGLFDRWRTPVRVKYGFQRAKGDYGDPRIRDIANCDLDSAAIELLAHSPCDRRDGLRSGQRAGLGIFPQHELWRYLGVWSHGIVVHCITISGGTSYVADSSR